VKTADGIFYTDLSERSIYYDPSKVSLIFASESFQHYPGQKSSVQGRNDFIGALNSRFFITISYFIEGMGVYFNISVNYHLETDDIVQDLYKQGRKFTHLPITYSPFKIDRLMEPPVKNIYFLFVNFFSCLFHKRIRKF
jgi:hypothetical protein